MTPKETSTDTASLDHALAEARGGAVAYRALALSFARPAEEVRRALAASGGCSGAGPLGDALAALAREAGQADLDTLRASYLRVFDPRCEPHPYEAEFRCEHFQQRTEMLADIAGFYRAFAAQPDTERPDHIACELDYLALLWTKEARALEKGEAERAGVCQEARRKFLDEHLLAWADDFHATFAPRAQAPGNGLLKAAFGAFALVVPRS